MAELLVSTENRRLRRQVARPESWAAITRHVLREVAARYPHHRIAESWRTRSSDPEVPTAALQLEVRRVWRALDEHEPPPPPAGLVCDGDAFEVATVRVPGDDAKWASLWTAEIAARPGELVHGAWLVCDGEVRELTYDEPGALRQGASPLYRTRDGLYQALRRIFPGIGWPK